MAYDQTTICKRIDRFFSNYFDNRQPIYFTHSLRNTHNMGNFEKEMLQPWSLIYFKILPEANFFEQLRKLNVFGSISVSISEIRGSVFLKEKKLRIHPKWFDQHQIHMYR